MIRGTLAAALLSLSLTASAMAQSDDLIPIVYESLSPTDARSQLLWADQMPVIAIAGEGVQIFSAEFPTSGQGSFLIQMLYGGGMCGLNSCTVRIAENGLPISDFSACDDYEQHFLSLDGTKFIACGIETDLSKTVPAPN